MKKSASDLRQINNWVIADLTGNESRTPTPLELGITGQAHRETRRDAI